ncbi:MAG: hypothetical protein ACRDF9_00460 [Candidatus Limnocylindria bacterium]
MGFAHAAGQARDELIARFQRLFEEGAIEGVAVVAADANACSACTVLADRVYVPRKLPRVPIEGCTGRGGCRCRYEPAVTVVE